MNRSLLIDNVLYMLDNVNPSKNKGLSLSEEYYSLRYEGLYSLKFSDSIISANIWAKDNLVIDNVDYTGFDVRIADIINENLLIMQKLFPSIMLEVKYISSYTKLQDYIHSSNSCKLKLCNKNSPITQKKNKKRLNLNTNIILSKTLVKFLSKQVLKVRNKINLYMLDKYGSISFVSLDNNFGIYFNDYYIKRVGKLLDINYKDNLSDISYIFEHYIIHEFNHIIEIYLRKNNNFKFVEEIWTSSNLKKNEDINYITDNISEYANKNISEFFAEAVYKYLVNDNPSELVISVGKGLEQALDINTKPTKKHLETSDYILKL